MVVVVVAAEEEVEDEGVAEDLVEAVEVDRAVVFRAERDRPWEVLHRLAVRREVDLRHLAHDLQFPRRGQEVPVDPLFRMLGAGRDQVLEPVICAQAHGLQFSLELDQALAQVTGGPQTFQAQVSVLAKGLAPGQGSQVDQVRDKGIVLGSLNSLRDCQGLAQDCRIRERGFKIAWAIRRTLSRIADPT